jgi:CheY-like chemotaxis protein
MARPRKIIIAEDDQTEQTFIREGFKKSGLFDVMSIQPDGHKLVKTLEKLDKSSLPDVILSDINMPLMNGLEALVKIKKNPALAAIPFIIFSTSKESTTETKCYNLGADKFMVKPANFNDYQKFAMQLDKAIS